MRRTSSFLIWALIATLSGNTPALPDEMATEEAPAVSDGRHPVPSSEQVQPRRAAIRQKLSAELATTMTAAGQRAVLLRAMEEAEASDVSVADRCATLFEIVDSAGELGVWAAGLDAIDRLGQHFEVDSLVLTLDLMTRAARSPDRDALSPVLDAVPESFEQAIATERYGDAEAVARAGMQLARRLRDQHAAARAGAMVRHAKICGNYAQRAARARRQLDADPADPSANLTLGTYLALVRRHWDEGLACLAKGRNSPLVDLAVRDIQLLDLPGEQVALADAWLAASNAAADEITRKSMRQRAQHYYSLALGAAGVDERPGILAKLDALSPKGMPYQVGLTFDNATNTWNVLTPVDREHWSFGSDGGRYQRRHGGWTRLRTARQFKGDLRYAIDIVLHSARYSNRGDCFVSLFGQTFQLRGMRDYRGARLKVTVTRRGSELLCEINGVTSRRTVSDAHLYARSTIEIRWRWRTAHVHSVKIEALEAFDPESE